MTLSDSNILAGQTVAAGKGKDSETRTRCLTDYFSVTGPSGSNPSVICGTNTGTHSKFFEGLWGLRRRCFSVISYSVCLCQGAVLSARLTTARRHICRHLDKKKVQQKTAFLWISDIRPHCLKRHLFSSIDLKHQNCFCWHAKFYGQSKTDSEFAAPLFGAEILALSQTPPNNSWMEALYWHPVLTYPNLM